MERTILLAMQQLRVRSMNLLVCTAGMQKIKRTDLRRHRRLKN